VVFFDKFFQRWSFLTFHWRRWSYVSKIRVEMGGALVGFLPFGSAGDVSLSSNSGPPVLITRSALFRKENILD
jgi:hypothetical protein